MPDEAWSLRDRRRLDALRDAGLLDTESDGVFDRLTRLTARVLDVPVSLVSLVDDHRQYFAGQSGLEQPWAGDRGTPLSHSFCQHVVMSDTALVVGDARGDARVCDNLAVRDIGVIAYAGMPLRTPEGVPLGSLCAIDTNPRTWTAADVEILAGLADAVSTEIALRLAVARQRPPMTALLEHLDVLAGDRAVPRETVDAMRDELDRLREAVSSLTDSRP
jgi:GAF domain-containing protein